MAERPEVVIVGGGIAGAHHSAHAGAFEQPVMDRLVALDS